jgi:hypothetical protein
MGLIGSYAFAQYPGTREAAGRRNYPEAVSNGDGRNGGSARNLTRTALTSTGATTG